VEALLKLDTSSQREIAKSVGLGQKAVHTIKKTLDDGLMSSPQLTTSGRDPILTLQARQVMLQECRKIER